jgi:hypothetical protein
MKDWWSLQSKYAVDGRFVFVSFYEIAKTCKEREKRERERERERGDLRAGLF